jgi:hypothetical protein
VGQIYNVLIILAITLLMVVATTVFAYLVDMVPHVFDSMALTVVSNNISVPDSDAAYDN